jgi:DNA-binding transcriptional regulator LsrR (DeoR family)
MAETRASSREIGASPATLARVAMLYYREGLTQGEIARRVGVSRASVANWLKHAREQNIVEIRIQGESFTTSPLARALTERLGIADAYVALDDREPLPAEAMRARTARLGAQAMHDLLTDGDRLGVAWGETVLRIAQSFPPAELPGLTVHQVTGSMYARHLFAAESCAIEIARRLGATCRTLHAPAVVSTAELAERLRSEPVIAEQLGQFRGLTKVLFSVGDVSDTTTLVSAGITAPADVAWYRERGAVGVLVAHFLDAEGRVMDGPVLDRMIGISPQVLRKVPTRMLVVCGRERLAAVRALLRGGYVTHLVIDEATARALLDDAES